MYERMPSVAENDIQNPPSRTLPGEIKIIITPAIESDVNGSDGTLASMDRYTSESIITERAADTENPVSARYESDKIIITMAITFVCTRSFLRSNINAPIRILM